MVAAAILVDRGRASELSRPRECKSSIKAA
jgi:hypothetical protein